MSINACIYDVYNKPAGCITNSVIDRFESEFCALREKHFGGIVSPVICIMEKSFVMSQDKMSADFLNCLKLVSRKYCDNLPIGFVQEVSRAYHFLVRHCCSQAVYDEVLNETIDQFRQAGLDYMSSNSQGFEQNDCMFEYKGKMISITMRQKEDLYRFWDANALVGNNATIRDGNDEYVVSVNGSPMDLADEIINCIEEDVSEQSDEEILNQIVGIIEELVKEG